MCICSYITSPCALAPLPVSVTTVQTRDLCSVKEYLPRQSKAQSPREETGTPNPVRPTEDLGQACLTRPQGPLPQAPLEDRGGSGVMGQGLL